MQGRDGKGHVALNDRLRNLIVGVAVPIGVGTLNAFYDRYTDRTASTTLSSKFGVGYFYFLSKRTSLYANVAHDSEASTRRTGRDVGIQHQF